MDCTDVYKARPNTVSHLVPGHISRMFWLHAITDDVVSCRKRCQTIEGFGVPDHAAAVTQALRLRLLLVGTSSLSLLGPLTW